MLPLGVGWESLEGALGGGSSQVRAGNGKLYGVFVVGEGEGGGRESPVGLGVVNDALGIQAGEREGKFALSKGGGWEGGEWSWWGWWEGNGQSPVMAAR